MNINKKQNFFMEQHLIVKQHCYKLLGKQIIWPTIHVKPINSEPIQELIPECSSLVAMRASTAFAL